MNKIDRRAKQIHANHFAFDAHCDSIHSVMRGERKLGEKSDKGHLDIPRMKEGGIKGQIFACDLHVYKRRSPVPTRIFLQMVDAFYKEIIDNESTVFVDSAEDFERSEQQGKIAAVLGMEDGEPVAGELSILRNFYRLGVRNLGLVWGYPNCIGTGVSTDEPSTNGLTNFGKEVVKECNRLGIVIDVAHINEAGFDDVMDISDDPVINYHANAYALHNHPRNMRDSQIKQIAENGGVVNVIFFFLHEEEGKNTVETLVDHIDYIVDLVGIEHVGIGSDFDGLEEALKTVKDASDYYKITSELLRRGYEEKEISKIIGGNLRRVFQQVI